MIAKKTTTKDTEGKETTTIDGYQIMLYLGRDDNEQNLVSVRHILVKFTGGTTDANSNTTYSPKEKETALAAIEAIKTEWLANGGTEEAFIALAKEKSTDDGSKANGGLYEDIYPGQMVTNFNDWCFAEEREPGNYEIVETEYGYHLLYFVAKQENTYRQLMIEDALRDEKYTNWYNEQHTETYACRQTPRALQGQARWNQVDSGNIRPVPPVPSSSEPPSRPQADALQTWDICGPQL